MRRRIVPSIVSASSRCARPLQMLSLMLSFVCPNFVAPAFILLVSPYCGQFHPRQLRGMSIRRTGSGICAAR